ncbi:hypothetical protein NDU88_006216 [Pleurodeles waltl]|uniref:Uncharacterized protein n=1 Tax=Pleurodeles waltl TaxID=8319 RepID=A0AAV7WCT5_PLEWA|nr:hypothetical protein NDU88_006216 [Pleurodeles waltl]
MMRAAEAWSTALESDLRTSSTTCISVYYVMQNESAGRPSQINTATAAVLTAPELHVGCDSSKACTSHQMMGLYSRTGNTILNIQAPFLAVH